MASRLVFPPTALSWLLGGKRARVLVIGATGGYPGLFVRAGHDVTVVDRDPARLSLIRDRQPQVHVITSRAEALPFDPSAFDVVAAMQNFHTFAPGLALAEWARVLKPGGWVALAYIKRDDSIPWVRKLAQIIQTRLPDAMRGDFGDETLAHLAQSPYFPACEQRHFRLWAPCTREELQAQAEVAQGADQLPAGQLQQLVEEVGQLYDDYARVPDPLQLPYSLVGVRGLVDHSELTSALAPPDDGLRIL
ncbi:MAG: class I SAM-dependent methyltransferase [Propionibacteriaceae bacterium]|jgi:SAM-dependent methyltransferase|nr:class I SAM-dependent methyltransferase [Propionibacteriaceae bacterium]